MSATSLLDNGIYSVMVAQTNQFMVSQATRSAGTQNYCVPADPVDPFTVLQLCHSIPILNLLDKMLW